MIRLTSMVLAAVAFGAVSTPTTAQTPVRDEPTILAFPLYEIDAGMSPLDARSALLAAGFVEEDDPDDWGKVPTATFKRGVVTVAITHLDGQINALGEVRIWDGTPFDYGPDLERIKGYFQPSPTEALCDEQPYGARCVVTDGVRRGARFVATLTEQQIFFQIRKSQPPEPPGSDP